MEYFTLRKREIFNINSLKNFWIGRSDVEKLNDNDVIKYQRAFYLYCFHFLQHSAKRWALTGKMDNPTVYFYYIVKTLKYFIKNPHKFHHNN